MMAVAVETDPTFDYGFAEQLFEDTTTGYPSDAYYDVDADGQRFLMTKVPEPSLRELTVVRNWFEELKERAPVN